MLTKRQHQLLHFIHERTELTGMSPTYEEMRGELRLGSKSGIHRIVMALAERGFIKLIPGRARSIVVVKPPSPNYKELALYWKMKSDRYLAKLKQLGEA